MKKRNAKTPLLAIALLLGVLGGVYALQASRQVLTKAPLSVVPSAPTDTDSISHLQLLPAEDSVPPANIRVVYADKYYIEFWEEGGTAPLKVLQMEDANPFANLPFPVMEQSLMFKLYDLTGISMDDLKPYLGTGGYTYQPPTDNYEYDEEAYDDEEEQEVPADANLPAFAYSSVIVSQHELMKDHTVANFNLSVYGKYERELASNSLIVVYNQKGEVVSSFYKPLGNQSVVVTWDGKYVATTIGGEGGMCGELYTQEEVIIMDAKTGETICSYPTSFYNPFLFTTNNHFIFINSYRKEGVYGYLTDFIVFDMEGNNIFKKTWPLKERPRLSNPNDFGADYMVYFKDGFWTSPVRAYFASDFERLGNLKK